MELQPDNAILFYEPNNCSATAIIAAAILYKLKKEKVNFQQMISKYNMVRLIEWFRSHVSCLACYFSAESAALRPVFLPKEGLVERRIRQVLPAQDCAQPAS